MRLLLLLAGLLSILSITAQTPIPPALDNEVYSGPREKMPLLLVDSCMLFPEAEQKSCVEEYMVNYIYSHIRWPTQDGCMTIEGLVVISWDVTAEGLAENLFIARGIHESLNQESLRVVKELLSLYNWRPGEQYGKPVQVRYNMPVRWRVSE